MVFPYERQVLKCGNEADAIQLSFFWRCHSGELTEAGWSGFFWWPVNDRNQNRPVVVVWVN